MSAEQKQNAGLTVEEVKRLVDALNAMASEIVSSTILPFQSLKEGKHNELVIAIGHCILNGPVGVKKETTFGKAQLKYSIASLFTENVTSKQWGAACMVVAKYMKSHDIKIQCQMLELYGDYWPLVRFQPGQIRQLRGQ